VNEEAPKASDTSTDKDQKPPRPKKGRVRRTADTFLKLIVAAAALLAGAAAYFVAAYTDPGPLEETAELVVPRGAGVATIAQELEAAGVVRSGLVFRAAVEAQGIARNLQAGEYEFPAGASLRDVIDILRDGAVIARRVTIPEGLTSYQIVEVLKAHPLLEGEVEEVPAEGSLLPETYFIERGTTRQSVIDRMEAGQAALLEELWGARADGLPVATPEEALILASIVEKETGVPEERPRVAAVFVNRLRKGMRLQSDPTIVYGVTEGKGALGRPIRRSEIDEATPYNTYQIDGLPPTPIANPGRAAIEAVLSPLETDDLFFVADGTGGHAFAETYAEHRANVARWRAMQKKDGAQ